MNAEAKFPGAEHLDYQCILGNRNITVTWLVSDQPTDTVAQWYRGHLTDFSETEPDTWLRHDQGRSRRLVVVGPAQSWPAGRPKPSIAPPETARTLIMHSTMSGGPI